MIDMKKRMAIVLSAVLACSIGMTAVAAPSPTIQQETVQDVTVSTPSGRCRSAADFGDRRRNTAVLSGTTFRNTAGRR